MTTFVSTLPGRSARRPSPRSGRERSARSAGLPRTMNRPTRPSSAPAAEPTSSTTFCAVGAHKVNRGTPPCHVTPYERDAAEPYTSSSTPGICTPVASSSRPASSYCAKPELPLEDLAARQKRDPAAEPCSPPTPGTWPAPRPEDREDRPAARPTSRRCRPRPRPANRSATSAAASGTAPGEQPAGTASRSLADPVRLRLLEVGLRARLGGRHCEHVGREHVRERDDQSVAGHA